MALRGKRVGVKIGLAVLVCACLHALVMQAQLSTADHLADPGFWPTQDSTARGQYAGSAACASCHAAKVASQQATSMARTAQHADAASVLHNHPGLNFALGNYRYEIKTSANGSIYTVTDSKRTRSADLLWAFGTGDVGQSYLFKQEDGDFYEARVTYFGTLNNLHFTPGRALASPKDLDEAMYRRVPRSEIGRCFACHTTASTIADQLDEKNLIPGVTCEACHGPGTKHIAAAEAAQVAGMPDAARGTILSAAQLSPIDAVDYCGACHGTWWDVKLSGAKGVSTVKSQPYRLESSKCWGKGDARLTCVACHDPHQQLRAEASSYDPVCLNCHVASSAEKPTTNHPGVACSVATKNCVSCHMPKVYVPEMHYKFADHRIRIVRAGETFPE